LRKSDGCGSATNAAGAAGYSKIQNSGEKVGVLKTLERQVKIGADVPNMIVFIGFARFHRMNNSRENAA
jgi:hypothetical protein